MILGQRLPPAHGHLPQLPHPDPLPQQPADLLIGDPRGGQHRQDHLKQPLPASPVLARSTNASSVLVFARDSRAETAWSNNATISSSWSIAA
jgi:hypothetical protein